MSSNFYSSIAKYYQHIFPFNPDQVGFLRTILPYNGARVLDVGCATGELAFALTHFGFPVWAFDFDPLMVELALNSKQEDTMFPVIEQLDMRAIDEHYPASFFDTVICFGNTLVHLTDDDDIRQFFRAAFQVIATDGMLSIQILNYDYIAGNQIRSLPLIDNEHVRFERNYAYGTDPHLIDFNTKLTIKNSGTEISNSVRLNPIRREKFQDMLLEAGFTKTEFFGNFKGDPLGKNSLQLVVSCQKLV